MNPIFVSPLQIISPWSNANPSLLIILKSALFFVTPLVIFFSSFILIISFSSLLLKTNLTLSSLSLILISNHFASFASSPAIGLILFLSTIARNESVIVQLLGSRFGEENTPISSIGISLIEVSS